MTRRRRFLTAREQHEMLSPWRTAASDEKRPLEWKRKEDYKLTPEQEKAVAAHHKEYNIGGHDDDFVWDDGNEDDAPEGVWTPPPYHKDDYSLPLDAEATRPHFDEDNDDLLIPGEMYGTHRERYLEDVFHGHLVDLTDQETIDSYEHQRKQPNFKGSDLEDTMWTNIANRYEGSGEHDDVNDEGDEDFGHPKIVDYFNKVHGCDEHMWSPPDRHEPHGNFGDHDPNWDPDAGQDPFDPRLFGASRTAAMNELDWDTFTNAVGDDPDEFPSAVTDSGDRYHVAPPWKHDEVPLNGFMDTVESEHPEMWALIHRYDPDNGFWDHAVTYHPSMEHAKGAAEHHHVTGEAPGRWPGTVPHSDYDPDDVEYWPERAQNMEDEREAYEDDEDDDEPGEPELPLDTRNRGLKWRFNDYDKYHAPRYMAEHPENPTYPAYQPGYDPISYEVQGPHAADNGLGHPEGSYSVRWLAPGWQGDKPEGYMTGEYQSNLSGRGYHKNLEDAIRWAENHAHSHGAEGFDPDDYPDPFDPRTFGASRDDG